MVQLKASYDAAGGVWPSSFMDKNNWHHIVFTADRLNNFAKFYVDGNLVDNLSGTSNNKTSSDLWNIGRKSIASYDSFCGKIDDIGIWNRALTASEVQQLYSGQLSTKETSKLLSVKYQPNPVENILHISSEEKISKVSVYNMVGQLVLTKNNNEKSISLDFSSISRGAYMVKVEAQNKTNEFKIIKK